MKVEPSLLVFGEETLDLLVPYRALPVVQLLYFLRHDVHRGHMVVLREQNRQ